MFYRCSYVDMTNYKHEILTNGATLNPTRTELSSQTNLYPKVAVKLHRWMHHICLAARHLSGFLKCFSNDTKQRENKQI